jgi:hypothetical protein
MKIHTACAEAERLSIKHKDTEFVVIVAAITKGIQRYQIATKTELLHSDKLYVPIKLYLNGKEEDYK